MHDSDFELKEEQDLGDGKKLLTIHVKAAGLTRRYELDSRTGNLKLIDEPLKVGGHDMTSIIGKRIREWLASR